MKKTLLATLLAMSMSQALTVAEAKGILAVSGSAGDSLDVSMTTSVQIMGKTIETSSQNVTKGKDKSWMEIKTPMGSQKVIRNGNRFSVSDFSGRTTVTEVPPQAYEQMRPSYQSALDSGEIQVPVSMGGDLYKVLVNAPAQGVTSREIVLDARNRRVVSVADHFSDGRESAVSMSYDPKLDPVLPKTVLMKITAGGQQSVIQITTTKVRSSRAFPDEFFEF